MSVKTMINSATALKKPFSKDTAISGLGGYLGQQYIDGKKDEEKQKAAAKVALENTNKQLAQADMAFNKANPKLPDFNSYKANNKAGLSDTLLTGIGGVNSNGLLLGKKTLLGS